MASSAANATGQGWKQCTASAGGHRNPRGWLGRPVSKFAWEKQESTKLQDIEEEAQAATASRAAAPPTSPLFFPGENGDPARCND